MGKIVGLVGFIGSGKGTVAETLVKRYNYRQDSFAASLKDACAVMFDWPRHLLEGDTTESREWREIPDVWWGEQLGIENFTPRYALQYIGTDVLRSHFSQDIWFLTLQNRLRKNPNQDVIISDVRFPNEIKFIQDQGGAIVRIHRGEDPAWFDIAKRANNGDIWSKSLMTQDPDLKKIHQSEWAWVGSRIDYTIMNSGTLLDLRCEAHIFAERMATTGDGNILALHNA